MRYRQFCLIFLLFFTLSFPAWAETFRLTVLHTNDLHGMMETFEYPDAAKYLHGQQAKMGGLARRATLINEIRYQSKHPVVLVDTGDIFTRGPWHKQWYGVPEIEAMNLMRYDMVCAGNNEFKAKDGPESQEVMLKLVQHSRFPWLAANLAVDATGKPPRGIQSFVVRKYGKVRVGFLGLTTDGINAFPQMQGWKIGEPITAAKQWIPVVRKQCDVLVLLTHIGTWTAQLLAAQTSDIDAIVDGHSHTFLTTPLVIKNKAGELVPIAQAGEHGVMLGKLDLVFERNNKQWRLLRTEAKLLPVTEAIPEDGTVKKLLQKYLYGNQQKAGVPAQRFAFAR